MKSKCDASGSENQPPRDQIPKALPGQSVSASAGSPPVVAGGPLPVGQPPQGPFASPVLPIDIGIGFGLPIRGPGGGGGAIRPPQRLPGR